ncbi:hypothetical protein H6M51_05020 [Rhizobium sp. AQ_MP]|uniref:hypothetical protein n=1 Tax=Rhizobium sp. AQ_MP TaxID=2761536 RepID=UPI00163971BB|nr:hypothetical protein [Rhizobium sp. AQ_MP]MBC2772211.1 hypothetical protein [Rhizobium sp. AQ_MP]
MKASLVIVTTAIVCAGVSAAGLTLWAVPQVPDRPATDPIVLATIPSAPGAQARLSAALHAGTVSPPAIFSVSNFKRKTVCLVERGAALTSRSRDFFAPPDCAQVWPGLTQATTWTQNEDGSVTISDASGTALLTLTRGRHFSYEVTDIPDADLALLMLP